MRLVKISIITCTSLLLCQCAPVYTTKYHFKAPASNQERQCANDCLKEKQLCFQECDKNSMITSVIGGIKNALNPLSSSSDNRSSNKCTNSCDENHRLCHINCGGKVITETLCISNCDKENK